MKIIGCDFHPSFQQIALLDRDTGEYTRDDNQHREICETLESSAEGSKPS